eukprot:12400114-Karenia_brevis.AAC.1
MAFEWLLDANMGRKAFQNEAGGGWEIAPVFGLGGVLGDLGRVLGGSWGFLGSEDFGRVFGGFDLKMWCAHVFFMMFSAQILLRCVKASSSVTASS